MSFQVDEVGEEDPDEEGAPNGEEARREKYVGVKVKVSTVGTVAVSYRMCPSEVKFNSTSLIPLQLSKLDLMFCYTWSRCPLPAKGRHSL
jgi:hypothetical protein